MTRTLLLGIDAGLTNLKAVAFDRGGDVVASASSETPGFGSKPGRDEQDHGELWAAVVDIVRAVVADDAVDPDAIAGVSVAGHGHGLYALGADGEPVVGVKSTDSRATDLVAEWRDDGTLAAAADHLGWTPFGGDPLSLLAWFDREAPETAARIDTILFCKDVLAYRFTGSATTDTMEGSVFRAETPDEAHAAFDVLGIEDHADAIPDPVPSTERCGTVTAAAEAETGLPAGTPVAAGLHDVGACALGAGVTDPGEAAVILGTWGQSVVVTGGPDDGSGGLPRRYLDGWLRYRGTRAGAACLDWFVEEFGDEWREQAVERGVDPYTVYEGVASDVPAGAGGVLFHPYLNGTTDDPDARGGFYGLGLDSTRADMLRAVYEGVAVAQVTGVRDLRTTIDAMRVTGGGARSDIWPAMFADVFGGPVTVPTGAEMGARGVAICAGVAADIYADVDAAVEETVTVEREYAADPDATARYERVARAFAEARNGLEPAWQTLKTIPPEDS
ncbi:FGGY-family carbohydrate kinase [Halarchaeum salinum]|uniref:FGGY-family carbohydrate kinase n=1 Tax=Halarchaeum salinum TaxID=489912 RepID=A0AAV3S6R6_9EURY